MTTRTIEYLPLDDIPTAAVNPKGHALTVIGESMGRHGYMDPVLLDERTGRLIGGHGRLETLAALRDAGEPPPEGVEVDEDGGWHVPVVRGWASASDMDAAAALVTLNRTTELGGWDLSALGELLEPLTLQKDGLLGVGFSRSDIAEMVAPPQTEDRRGSDTDPADIGVAPGRTQPGDIWTLGRHTLVCGDSRHAETVKLACAGARPDQIWTDPPYGVAYVGKTAEALTIMNDQLDPIELDDFLFRSIGSAVAEARPGATVFVASPSGPLFDIFAGVLGRLGCRRHTLVWVKDRFVLGRADYHYRHEFLFFGLTPNPDNDPEYRHQPIMFGWKPGGPHQAPEERTFDSVWDFPRPTRSDAHPTMKPVALIERAIANHTKPDDHVLDIFGGSGSTLIAADNLDRISHLVELDPHYCDVILDRWERHGGVAPVLGHRD